MQMVDDEEEDDKIIAISQHDPAFAHYQNLEELGSHTLRELQRFFQDYKMLEHGSVRVERMLGKEDALDIIRRSFDLYNRCFERGGAPKADAPKLGKDK